MKNHAVFFGILYIILSCTMVITLAVIMPMEDTPLMSFLVDDSVVDYISQYERALLLNSPFVQVIYICFYASCLNLNA